MVMELPTQFNEATNRTIELIDVLWLKGNSIVAAFEVECTTSVYSGLLRMSDLLALQLTSTSTSTSWLPTSDAARCRRRYSGQHSCSARSLLLRSVDSSRPSELSEKVEGARRLGLTSSLKPEFLDQLAEYLH